MVSSQKLDASLWTQSRGLSRLGGIGSHIKLVEVCLYVFCGCVCVFVCLWVVCVCVCEGGVRSF